MAAPIAAAYGRAVDDPVYVMCAWAKLGEEGEEGGEVLGAYLRMAGLSRRSGTLSEFAAELADVVICVHMAATVSGIADDLVDSSLSTKLREHAAAVRREPASEFYVFRSVSRVAVATGEALDAVVVGASQRRLLTALHFCLDAAYQASFVTGVDLDAAVTAKLTVVFERGWRTT